MGFETIIMSLTCIGFENYVSFLCDNFGTFGWFSSFAVIIEHLLQILHM